MNCYVADADSMPARGRTTPVDAITSSCVVRFRWGAPDLSRQPWYWTPVANPTPVHSHAQQWRFADAHEVRPVVRNGAVQRTFTDPSLRDFDLV